MRKTNLQRQAEKLLTPLLEGHILAIDPSSGSRDSMPGYAVFRAGLLIDSGLIQVQQGRELNRKLFSIGETLRNQFEVPDILVVEHIPPFMRGSGFSKSIVILQRAIGMIIGSIDRPLHATRHRDRREPVGIESEIANLTHERRERWKVTW